MLSRPQLRVLLALWLLSCTPNAVAAPVTFREVLERRVRGRGSPIASEREAQYDGQAGGQELLHMAAGSVFRDVPDSEPEPYPSVFTLLTEQLATSSIQAGTSLVSEGPQFPAPFQERSRRAPLLHTILLCLELAKVNSQLDVVDRQERLTEKLLDIENRRVSEGIDNPVLLTSAKLLKARTRIWAAAVRDSARQLRRLLAQQTGLPDSEIVAESIPRLPDVMASANLRWPLGNLAAVREVAQLEYILAHTHAVQTLQRTVTGAASQGDLTAAYIAEDEKFNALLQMNFEVQSVELQLLESVGMLERWALEGWQPEAGLFLGDPELRMDSPTREPDPEKIPTNPLTTIMITPFESKLMVGESRQFSAIAVYRDGKGVNASSGATWVCSNGLKAVVSGSGLVTALAEGEVTITVIVSGVSQSHRVLITPEQPTAFFGTSAPAPAP